MDWDVSCLREAKFINWSNLSIHALPAPLHEAFAVTTKACRTPATRFRASTKAPVPAQETFGSSGKLVAPQQVTFRKNLN